MAVAAPEQLETQAELGRQRQTARNGGGTSPSLHHPLPLNLGPTGSAPAPTPATAQRTAGAARPTKAEFDGQRLRSSRNPTPNQARRAAAQKKAASAAPVSDVDMTDFFRRCMTFSMIGLMYDVLILILDAVDGLGIFVNIIGGAFMGVLYWYMVWRFLPASLKGKSLMEFGKAKKRFWINFLVKQIPFLGQFWAGWTGVAIDAYFMVKHEQDGLPGSSTVQGAAAKAGAKASAAG